MESVFCSGSCRLLLSICDDQDHFFDCGDLANFNYICDKFLLNEELYKKIKIFLYFE